MTETEADNYAAVDRLEANNLWEIRIVKPDPTNTKQLRDRDGWDESQPCFYWVDVEIWCFGNNEWDKVLEGFVKWDGCSNWWLVAPCLHFCGLKDAELLMTRAMREAIWILNGVDMKDNF